MRRLRAWVGNWRSLLHRVVFVDSSTVKRPAGFALVALSHSPPETSPTPTPGGGLTVQSVESIRSTVVGLRAASEAPKEAHFTCPVCCMTSYYLPDVTHGYCGNCHAFTGLRL